jgi:hypothetical protein
LRKLSNAVLENATSNVIGQCSYCAVEAWRSQRPWLFWIFFVFLAISFLWKLLAFIGFFLAFLENFVFHVVYIGGTHHDEGQVDPKMYKKTVTGFRYPRACRIRKYQIENTLPSLPLPTFFKT